MAGPGFIANYAKYLASLIAALGPAVFVGWVALSVANGIFVDGHARHVALPVFLGAGLAAVLFALLLRAGPGKQAAWMAFALVLVLPILLLSEGGPCHHVAIGLFSACLSNQSALLLALGVGSAVSFFLGARRANSLPAVMSWAVGAATLVALGTIAARSQGLDALGASVIWVALMATAGFIPFAKMARLS